MAPRPLVTVLVLTAAAVVAEPLLPRGEAEAAVVGAFEAGAVLHSNSTARLLSTHISKVVLIAERHTGSTWMTAVLKRAFGVAVMPRLCTYKHFFQTSVHRRLVKTGTGCQENCEVCKNPSGVLVVVLARNPYDWVASMHRQPWHAHRHMRMSKADFLRAEWSPGSEFPHMSRTKCVPNYVFGEVAPCVTRDQKAQYCKAHTRKGDVGKIGCPPVYDLNPDDGGFFRNILHMRARKHKDFLDMQEWAEAFELLRYDDVLSWGPSGLIKWLQNVGRRHGIRVNDMSSLSTAGEGMRKSRGRSFYYTKQVDCDKCRFTSAELELVNGLVDWDVETKLGFHRVDAGVPAG